MTGPKLSHYEVIEKLDAGGMGVVYRARDTHLDRTVALKVLRPEALGDPERMRRFVQEAKAASALNHPNIVVIHDIDRARSDSGDVDFRSTKPEIPAGLERIVLRCLEKNREARYPSAGELLSDLAAFRSRFTETSGGLGSLLRRPRYAVPFAALALALVAGGAWLWVRSSRVRWARNVALPEIARLVEKGDLVAAFRLARQAERHIPEDRELQRFWRERAFAASIHTTPPDAAVYFKDYLDVGSAWEYLGRTPIDNIRVPDEYLRFRIEKSGFEAVEGAPDGELANEALLFHFTLVPLGAAPPGMVRVPGASPLAGDAPVELEEFWLDRHEVTNRDFKRFVDQGGYEKPEHWKQAFVKDGRALSFAEAMAEFRDRTGRPGPATWELGNYAVGEAEFPVAGVSWYEAAAYADFAGKSLPTVHHWQKAAERGLFSKILMLSNFGGQGAARVGSHPGLGPYGTYDMAGNVKEWCLNPVGGKRYILGGAWSEPSYVFGDTDAEPPFDRLPAYGFRCAKYASPLPESLTGEIEIRRRDHAKEKPAGDEAFGVYRSLYDYDRTDLRPAVDSVDEGSEHWRRERVSFDAAYGGERVIADLFLPRSAAPPYQTVIYFPGSSAEVLTSGQDLEVRWFDFIVKSGRALLLPMYKGTYQRRLDQPAAKPGHFRPSVRRDLVIQWSKDLGRSIDYLETRPDVDRQRLAFYGFSLGAVYGPVLAAVEGRLATTVLLAGGLPGTTLPPEVDPIHFAPRVRMPVLMVNGRQDFIRPVETSQVPLFRLLGTPEKDKRHVVLDGGHLPPTMHGVIKKILDWLDQRLGPVNPRRS